MNTTLNTLVLPDDMVWKDELDWAPVGQTMTPTLDGSLLLEDNPLFSGRPITLVGIAGRGLVLQLKALEAQLSPRMTLTLHDGLSRTVYWRRPGVKASPYGEEFADPTDADPYNLELNFTWSDE
jgi:hypothetical protein